MKRRTGRGGGEKLEQRQRLSVQESEKHKCSLQLWVFWD